MSYTIGARNWFVYMVRCRDGSIYTGITLNLARRVAAHNAGRGAKYTRSRRPVVLVWYRLFDSRTAAAQFEARLKRLRHDQKWGVLTGAVEVA